MMVPWQKDFELGHARIDAEHREVVDLLNELDVCIAANAPAAMIDRVLADLVRAVTGHLETAHTACPNAFGADMVGAVNQVHRHWQSGHGMVARQALKLLARDWLDHVCERRPGTVH